MAPRVVVLSASIGAGHDLPAELLRDALAERGVPAEVRDGLAAMGPVVQRAVMGGSDFESPAGLLAADALYAAFTHLPPGRRAAGRLLEALGGPGLRRDLARDAPAVVVSTYPGVTETLGRLRRRGALHLPLVAVVTDLSALTYWAHPGADLHLVTHPESIPEVRAIAGAGADVVAVRGFDPPGFDAPPSRAAARTALGLPAAAPVVLVSGGGWGVGDVPGALAETLAVPDAHALVLCGTNAALRERLAAAHAGDERVRVLGFTDRMPELMAAADVLIHSTAGLTVLEAAICGCRTISYGWGRGHIRANNRAFREHGLAAVAGNRRALRAALADALARPREPDAAWFALPAAADVLLDRFPALQQPR